jgi:hypothetical protein
MISARSPVRCLWRGATAVLIQPNDDIVAIGFSEDNATGVTDIALVRYLG